MQLSFHETYIVNKFVFSQYLKGGVTPFHYIKREQHFATWFLASYDYFGKIEANKISWKSV